jgi:hypothetical protein
MKGIHLLSIQFPDISAIHYTTLKLGKEEEKSFGRVGFPIWNKCGVMSRTWHKTLAT